MKRKKPPDDAGSLWVDAFGPAAPDGAYDFRSRSCSLLALLTLISVVCPGNSAKRSRAEILDAHRLPMKTADTISTQRFINKTRQHYGFDITNLNKRNGSNAHTFTEEDAVLLFWSHATRFMDKYWQGSTIETCIGDEEAIANISHHFTARLAHHFTEAGDDCTDVDYSVSSIGGCPAARW